MTIIMPTEITNATRDADRDRAEFLCDTLNYRAQIAEGYDQEKMVAQAIKRHPDVDKDLIRFVLTHLKTDK